jgi:hypothetical protein
VKPDERKFLRLMQSEGWTIVKTIGGTDNGGRLMPRRIIERESAWLNEKRALYILEKWAGKGWYDYGTVIDGGWLTDKGIAQDTGPEGK